MAPSGHNGGEEDIWRSLGALEAQGEERTRQIERLFVILGDVKYESSKIAACVESLSEQFRQHMIDEARDLEAVVTRVQAAEKAIEEQTKKITSCADIDIVKGIFPKEEDVDAAKTLISVWKVITGAFKGAANKILMVIFFGAMLAVAAHFGIKVTLPPGTH